MSFFLMDAFFSLAEYAIVVVVATLTLCALSVVAKAASGSPPYILYHIYCMGSCVLVSVVSRFFTAHTNNLRFPLILSSAWKLQNLTLALVYFYLSLGSLSFAVCAFAKVVLKGGRRFEEAEIRWRYIYALGVSAIFAGMAYADSESLSVMTSCVGVLFFVSSFLSLLVALVWFLLRRSLLTRADSLHFLGCLCMGGVYLLLPCYQSKFALFRLLALARGVPVHFEWFYSYSYILSRLYNCCLPALFALLFLFPSIRCAFRRNSESTEASPLPSKTPFRVSDSSFPPPPSSSIAPPSYSDVVSSSLSPNLLALHTKESPPAFSSHPPLPNQALEKF